MEPMTCRALLTLRLLPEQRNRLRDYEKTFPPGRYMTGNEICKMFRLKPESIPESETERIDAIWFEYRKRIGWKQGKLNDLYHENVCSKTKQRIHAGVPWCECPTPQEDIHVWEDWFIENGAKEFDEIEWTLKQDAFSIADH